MRRLGPILAMMILSLQGWAQEPYHYFNFLDDHHGRGFTDAGFDIMPLSDSTYLVCGLTNDSFPGTDDPYIYGRPFFMVLGAQGEILQKKSYARAHEQLYTVDNDILVRTPDGGYAVSGLWQRWDSLTATYCYYGTYLLKVDALLDSSWIVLDSGSMVPNKGLNIRKMLVGADGSFILCGNDNLGHTQLQKYSSLGGKLWDKLLPWAATYMWTIQNLPNGNFMLTGQRGYSGYIGEFDLGGNVTWDTTFNSIDPWTQNGCMALRLSGGGYFVYDFLPDNTGALDMHCMWWDAARHKYRERTVAMPEAQYARSMFELEDGSIVMAGQTATAEDPMIDKRAFLLKFSPGGELLWLRQYHYWHGGHGPLYDCARAPDGGFVFTGGSFDTTRTSPFLDTWICKVDSVGCPFANCGPSLAVDPSEIASLGLVEAWPNPTSDRLRLRSRSGGLLEAAVMRLFALDGRVLDELVMPLGFEEISFDVSRLAPGAYLWEYRDASGLRDAGKFEVVR